MSDVSSPKATRQSLPRWLDPKLLLGILLVLISMAMGARVIAQADDSVEVWALARSLPLNSSLTQDDLVAKRVRFTDQDDADRYVGAGEDIRDGARMVRSVGEGEFLPRDAFTTKKDENLNDIPIGVEAQHLPGGLGVGDSVDVYVVPEGNETEGQELTTKAELVLSDVVVNQLGTGGGLSGTGEGTTTIRVAVTSDVDIPMVAAAVVKGTAVIVKHVGTR